jgi:ribosomal protein S18 acetylase RimI-like enzyme
MQVEYFGDALSFDQAAGQWLAAAERENGLVLSVLQGELRRAGAGRGWVVREHGALRLALFQATPRYLLLSQGSVEAARRAAENVEGELPGAVGPAEVTDAYTKVWASRHGCDARLNAEMTFFTLEAVEPFTRPSGCLRRASPEEFEKLIPLAAAAARDMNLPAPEQEPSEVEGGLRRAIAEGRQFVLADGASVRAMAAYVNTLPGAGARIRGVYTPPQYRGRGYGTAVAGALAVWLLEEGEAWVSLFADNANPVSTGIYKRLGFRAGPVFRSWRFETT